MVWVLFYLDQLLATRTALGATKERGAAMGAFVAIFVFFRPLLRPQAFPFGDSAEDDFLPNGKRKIIN